MGEGAGARLEPRLDRSSPVPLYAQLARALEAAIADGQLGKGLYLGNEVELAERWQVSRPTVRRAIQELVDDGLLVRQRGVGTQVVSDQIHRRITMMSLHDDLVAQGRSPVTIVITLEHVIADASVSTALELPIGSTVVHIERSREADGRRLAIMRNWLTIAAAGDVTAGQLARGSLYALLRARGVRPHSADVSIGADATNPTDAALLGLSVGAPVLTMRRVMRDSSGRPVDVGTHVFDAAHFRFDSVVIAG